MVRLLLALASVPASDAAGALAPAGTLRDGAARRQVTRVTRGGSVSACPDVREISGLGKGAPSIGPQRSRDITSTGHALAPRETTGPSG